MSVVVKSKSLSSLIKEADRLFSLLVRQRDINEIGLVKCCTCGKIHYWRKMDNGHFLPRQHQSTRFDEKNTGPQCTDCNHFHEGCQFRFSQYLNEKYGEGTAEAMEIKSKMTCKRTAFDLKYMINEFKTELRRRGHEIR